MWKTRGQVCRRLGIPHDAFDLRDRFDAAVVRPFCEAYLEGRTPNPCIACNRFLKFESLQKRRRQLGLDYVATGHYARRRWDEATGCWQLLRASDPAKDQSYVLYHLTQDTLAHMLFPLGELTKDEVRELARAHGFVTAEKPESQDICFVPDGDYARFIEEVPGVARTLLLIRGRSWTGKGVCSGSMRGSSATPSGNARASV